MMMMRSSVFSLLITVLLAISCKVAAEEAEAIEKANYKKPAAKPQQQPQQRRGNALAQNGGNIVRRQAAAGQERQALGRIPQNATKRPAAVQRRQCSSSSSSSHYQPPAPPCHGTCDRISAIPDTGFYSFSYAGANTWVPRSFYVCNSEPVRLSITGCFCVGDYFEVFDNCVPVIIAKPDSGFPVFPTTTPCVPVNDPAVCAADGAFAHGFYDLKPGTHNITIYTGASLYGGGAGFIRLDTLCAFSTGTLPCCSATGSCPQFIVA